MLRDMTCQGLDVISTIKKLGIGGRLVGHTLAKPVASPFTGEILADEGDFVSYEKAMEIEQAG